MHPNNTQFKQDHQPEKYNTKTTFSRKYFPIPTKWKGNSNLWPDSHKMSVAIFTPTPDINKWQMSLCNNSSHSKSY